MVCGTILMFCCGIPSLVLLLLLSCYFDFLIFDFVILFVWVLVVSPIYLVIGLLPHMLFTWYVLVCLLDAAVFVFSWLMIDALCDLGSVWCYHHFPWLFHFDFSINNTIKIIVFLFNISMPLAKSHLQRDITFDMKQKWKSHTGNFSQLEYYEWGKTKHPTRLQQLLFGKFVFMPHILFST